MSFRHLLMVIAAAAALTSRATAQQTADVLKGRVVNDSGKVVAGAPDSD
jgi:hypothetical protein